VFVVLKLCDPCLTASEVSYDGVLYKSKYLLPYTHTHTHTFIVVLAARGWIKINTILNNTVK